MHHQDEIAVYTDDIEGHLDRSQTAVLLLLLLLLLLL
jgi:hypothetical protein